MNGFFLAWRSLLSFFALMLLCCGCRFLLLPTQTDSNSVHLWLGNPSHAVAWQTNQTELIVRPQYALQYNRIHRTADWVSWQLNQSWLGTLNRPPFTPDPDLPSRWAVTPKDYTNSGFDRGHLVPAADRNRTPADSAAVFYMSNIVPQAPDNNRGPWEGLEHYCRELVRSGKELYIMAGPVGSGGVGEQGQATTIAPHQESAQGKITVPSALWKIVVVNPKPGLDLTDINANTRVIAVLIPNRQGIKETDWYQFRTTVRELETQTGYDFLANLPQDLQDTLETQADQSKKF